MNGRGARRRGRRAGIALLAVFGSGLLAGGVVVAATPASLQITQALAQGTHVTAYVAAEDESGAPLTTIEAGQLQATLGTQLAEVVSATPFPATDEGVLSLFLVDISRSLDEAQFARIRQALRDWIAALGEHDRAALLTFGTQVRTLVSPTDDHAVLESAITALAPTDSQTALHQALATGLALGRQRGEGLPTRRAIVILSDGLDDAPGGMTAEEVLAQMEEGSVPIYAIGYSRVRDRVQREAGLAALGRFARRTGGAFIDAGATDPSAAYATLRARIQAVTRVRIECETCVADGNRYRLRIGLSQSGLTLTDGMDVRLYPETAPLPPTSDATTEPEPEPESGTETESEPAPTESADEASSAPPDAQADSPPAPPVASADVVSMSPAVEPVEPLQAWLKTWWPALIGVTVLLMLGLWLAWRSRARTDARTEPQTPLTHEPVPIPEPLPESKPASPPPPRGPALRLTHMNGRRRGQTVRLVLAPAALIGRSASCALVLAEDDEVSAQHARLSQVGKGMLLEDLGSTNGTLLNGVPLSAPHPVREGDVLRIGQTELRLVGIEAE